jgi:hypothetical protein
LTAALGGELDSAAFSLMRAALGVELVNLAGEGVRRYVRSESCRGWAETVGVGVGRGRTHRRPCLARS